MDRTFAYTKSLWADLKDQEMLPYGQNLMTDHEDELRNLVQHIEIRVKAREEILKAQLTKIYKHLDMKMHECQQQNAMIEDYSNKILSLKEKVNGMIEWKQGLDTNHDEQLNKLKSQAIKLKELYGRLYEKYLSNMNDLQKQNEEQRDNIIQRHSRDKKRLIRSVQNLTAKLKTAKTQKKQDDRDIRELVDLVRFQDSDLIDPDDTDDLLKKSIAALRSTLEGKNKYIADLEAELTQCLRGEENREKLDYAQIQTLMNENTELGKELAKHKEASKDYYYLKEQVRQLKVSKYQS
ncbi:uncharacterized protein LOC106878641 [Octopus bimaculoides]|nr:uncharacterized protein LOC106878641 [Octopus bimaculoides]|eukprot:XP_014783408.1 PREDICTED: uncharacterized protein LOC106878641 [Octopus bimaculoides]